jgi:hypothetical protein
MIAPSSNASVGEEEWNFGPDLNPPGLFKRGISIISYALKHHLIQILIMISALGLLVIGVLKWDVLFLPVPYQNAINMIAEIIQNMVSVMFSPNHFQNATTVSYVSASNWADWWIRIQSLLGIGTLFVAIFVWYGEIREDWENDLPKRMSVFFFYGKDPVIVCRYVWLAGPDDLRAWGQQVAAQAVGERFLDFSPDISTQGPRLVVEANSNDVCKHYALSFMLINLPSSVSKDLAIEDSGICRYKKGEEARKCQEKTSSQILCRYQNCATKDTQVYSIPSEKVAALSVVSTWKMTVEL